MKEKALEYGKLACDTMMRKFNAPDLPPKGSFHYHAGVFLSGMMNIYAACGEEKYFNYMKDWVDSIITEDGVIQKFSEGTLDDHMAGILLFPLYERYGQQRYIKALRLLMGNIRNWKKNEKGGFWHKGYYPNQMWLDGLYMAGPLQAIYAEKFNEPLFLEEAVKQALLMYENMQEPKTKLLCHAWDVSKEAVWADKETGRSPELWGRAMGWYVVALLDILEYMPANHPAKDRLIAIEKELLSALRELQDEKSGMWYQVLDKKDKEDNWQETSCSCLFVYAMAKAVRMRIIESDFMECVKKGFEGVLTHSVRIENGDLLLSGVCIGTGVCDYEAYISRPTSANDLHGMGGFLLMCAELAAAKTLDF